MENTKINLETTVHTLCQKELGEGVKDLRKIEAFGIVNVVYFVETNKRRYIFRLNTEDGLGQFLKESWCMDEAHKKGIPTTSVLKCSEIDNTAYMIQPYIEGVNGSELENKKIIWESLGKYARLNHGIAVSGFGDRMSEKGVFDGSWQKYLQYNIDSLTEDDKLLQMGAFDITTSQKLRECFKRLSTIKLNFGLCHADFSDTNVIVDNDSKVWLIDWGSAEAHIVPHLDFSVVLKDHLTKNSELFKYFLTGYGMSLLDFEKLEPELNALTVLIATDKLRWAIDRKPKKIEEFSIYLKKIIALVV